MKYKTFFLFFFLLIFVSCSNETKDPILEKAASLHNDAVKIEQLTIEKLDSLGYIKEQLINENRVLSETEHSFIQSVGKLESDIKNWSENLIEVPGFEHNDHHDHDHDHHHHNDSQPEVTPEHMLNIQTEFRDSILAIQRRVNGVLIENK